MGMPLFHAWRESKSRLFLRLRTEQAEKLATITTVDLIFLLQKAAVSQPP
jgi:hypothetical protein